MPQNIFITGVPKSGKTTLLEKLANELTSRDLKVCGFVSPDEKHSGKRTKFYVKDIRTGKNAILADINGDGPKVNKYKVNIKSFESICIPALEDFENCDVVIIDEIGLMESKSNKFLDLLDQILESNIPLVAILHNNLTDKYGVNGQIYYLTEDNRSELMEELLEKIRSMKKKENIIQQSMITKKSKKPKAQIKIKSKKQIEKQEIEEEIHSEEKTQHKKGGLLEKIRELLGI